MAGEDREMANVLQGDVYRTGRTSLALTRALVVPLAVWLSKEAAGLVRESVTGMVPGVGERGVVRYRNLTNLLRGQERDYIDLSPSLKEAIDEHTYAFNRTMSRYGIPVSICEDPNTGEKSLFFAARDTRLLQKGLESFLRGTGLFADEEIADLLEGREPARERALAGGEMPVQEAGQASPALGDAGASARKALQPGRTGERGATVPQMIPAGWDLSTPTELTRTLVSDAGAIVLRASTATGLVTASVMGAGTGAETKHLGAVAAALPLTVGRLEQAAEMLSSQAGRRPLISPAEARRRVAAISGHANGAPVGRDTTRGMR